MEQLINGLVIGSLYGLIGLGLTAIFGMMKIVNIAHGEFYMWGAIITAYLVSAPFKLNYVIVLIISAFLLFGIGIAVERITLKPLRNQAMITTTICTVSLSMIFNQIALIITKGVPKFIQVPNFFRGNILILGISIGRLRLFSLMTAIFIVLAAHFYLKNSLYGKSLRAAFQNQKAAALVGINIDHVYAITYGSGVFLAAIAGGLLGAILIVEPMMGSSGLLKAFVVVIIGGMGSFPGAFIGGLLLGITEVIAINFGFSAYRDLFGFVMVILFLIFRPTGLFGRKE